MTGCSLLGERTGQVRITVKMTDGTPITEAEVKLLDGSKEVTKGSVNSQGVVVLTAKPGSYTVEVRTEAIDQLVLVESDVVIEAKKQLTKKL
jgi:outer membrane usher protein FimD/PapC